VSDTCAAHQATIAQLREELKVDQCGESVEHICSELDLTCIHTSNYSLCCDCIDWLDFVVSDVKLEPMIFQRKQYEIHSNDMKRKSELEQALKAFDTRWALVQSDVDRLVVCVVPPLLPSSPPRCLCYSAVMHVCMYVCILLYTLSLSG
jgi:hypothetical protein